MKNSLVSIVIPCYNTREYVAEAVRSAFAQTYAHKEVLVVDDGSTDGSLEVLKEMQEKEFPSLIVLQHEDYGNHGVSSTRRRGVLTAKGEYIAFLDADDVLLPKNIERQLQVLQDNPKVILCHTGMSVIGDTSDADIFEKRFIIRPELPYWYHKQSDFLVRNGISCSSVLVKKEVLLSVPFNCAQLYQHEDWLCWCLLAKKGLFICLPEKLALYRVHSSSATSAVRKSILVAQYSKLEMKLTLAIRSESVVISIRALASALRNLIALINIYSINDNTEQYGLVYRVVKKARRLKSFGSLSNRS